MTITDPSINIFYPINRLSSPSWPLLLPPQPNTTEAMVATAHTHTPAHTVMPPTQATEPTEATEDTAMAADTAATLALTHTAATTTASKRPKVVLCNTWTH